MNLIAKMVDESGDFSFENIFEDIIKYSKNHDILTVGVQFNEQHHVIKISPEEIESYESQYMLAHIIKKTERLYREMKENSKPKSLGKLSFRSFLSKQAFIFTFRKYREKRVLKKINMKLVSKTHFRTEKEKVFYEELLKVYHSYSEKIERDITCKLIRLI